MKKANRRNKIVTLTSAAAATSATLSAALASPLQYAPAPADNPLKGFIPFAGTYNNFPHSMEWFYISLKDIQTDYNAFDWSRFDEKLDAIAKRGHQAVFRITLDYPDQPSGVPDFLSHVTKHAYTEYDNGKHFSSYAPDYENLDLRRALTSFIAAFGKRYDGDPRIGFITIGLLGFWGEWHTYPHIEWMASTAVQNEVLDAFDASFNVTKLLLREPKENTNAAQRHIGYHDDSFAYETLPPTDWYFWSKMQAQGVTGIWKTEPIGGELRPEMQACIWDDAPCTPPGQEYNLCVKTTHCSWLINHGAFKDLTGERYQRAVAGARKLGYELFVSDATINAATTTNALKATVKVRNVGVAPFYYNWKVQIGVADASARLIKQWDTNWNLTGLLPSTPDAVWKLNRAQHGLGAGRYRLLLRAANPLPGGHTLKFANATQDQDLSAWLTLGSFVVSKPSPKKPVLKN